MSHNKKDKKILIPKLVAVNSIVVLLGTLFAGVFLKDYACFLVNFRKITGQELVERLNVFLLIISIPIFFGVSILQYFSVKKILHPVNILSQAALNIRKGRIPPIIEVNDSGELGELSRNFNSMVAALTSTQEQREELLRDIAHELRTPLTNINGYLEALQNGVIDGDPELFGSLLDESRRLTRIVELITELNDWDKTINFLEKPFTNIDIKEILSESLISFQLKLDAHFSTTKILILSALIFGHKDGLKQVFSNILQNIIDYNEGNWLEISSVYQTNSIIISFSHKGKFIDPGKKEKIFERFYRLEESRTTKGAGLGLAISKSIIEAHNGSIGLTTTGNNHTFWISIPVIT